MNWIQQGCVYNPYAFNPGFLTAETPCWMSPRANLVARAAASLVRRLYRLPVVDDIWRARGNAHRKGAPPIHFQRQAVRHQYSRRDGSRHGGGESADPILRPLCLSRFDSFAQPVGWLLSVPLDMRRYCFWQLGRYGRRATVIQGRQRSHLGRARREKAGHLQELELPSNASEVGRCDRVYLVIDVIIYGLPMRLLTINADPFPNGTPAYFNWPHPDLPNMCRNDRKFTNIIQFSNEDSLRHADKGDRLSP